MELSEFLKRDRESKFMTQEQYSKEIGISRSTLASLETDNRTPSKANAKKLVEYFKKPLDELLGTEKINRLATLETTNLLIDSLIANDQITNENIDNKVKTLIWESLSLEILIKLLEIQEKCKLKRERDLN